MLGTNLIILIVFTYSTTSKIFENTFVLPEKWKEKVLESFLENFNALKISAFASKFRGLHAKKFQNKILCLLPAL